jgi:hypothetical protein
MDDLIKMVEREKKNLKEIYLKERLTRGNGILMITLVNNEVKVFYSTLEECSIELQTEIMDRQNNNISNVIYFYLCADLNNASIIEIMIND